MNIVKMLALLAALSMSLGCATAIDIAKDACDTALEGSKAGALCDKIDKLKKEEEVEE